MWGGGCHIRIGIQAEKQKAPQQRCVFVLGFGRERDMMQQWEEQIINGVGGGCYAHGDLCSRWGKDSKAERQR